MLGLLVGSFLNVVIYRVPLMIDREMRVECALFAAAEAGKPLTELPEEPPWPGHTGPISSAMIKQTDRSRYEDAFPSVKAMWNDFPTVWLPS